RKIHYYLADVGGGGLGSRRAIHGRDIHAVVRWPCQEVQVGKRADTVAKARAVKRAFGRVKNHFHLAETIRHVVRGALGWNNFDIIGALFGNRENVVVIVVVVRDDSAAESDIEIFLFPDAGFTQQSAQREFVVAFVRAVRWIEASRKIS